MSQHILQFLVNNIVNTMLTSATPQNLYVREKCFKDLDYNEVTLSKFTIGKKSGLWGCFISSKSRRFQWPDKFSFKTQELVNILKDRAANVRSQKEIFTKVDYYGIYYVQDTGKLVLVVPPGEDLEGKDVDMNICTIPKSMVTFSSKGKTTTLDVNHPYVVGTIQVVYRQI